MCLNISGETKNGVLFSVSLQAYQRKLFFSLEGTGLEESSRRWQLCLLPFSAFVSWNTWGSGGKWAEASPDFPFAAGKQVPCVARAAASGSCCLSVAKAKGPGASSLCSPTQKLLSWEFWSCPSTGSRGPGEKDGLLLYLQDGDASSVSVQAHTGCDCCRASTSGNSAGAWLSSTSDNEKWDWSC